MTNQASMIAKYLSWEYMCFLLGKRVWERLSSMQGLPSPARKEQFTGGNGTHKLELEYLTKVGVFFERLKVFTVYSHITI